MKEATLIKGATIANAEKRYTKTVPFDLAVGLVKKSNLHADFFVEKDALLAAAFPETKATTAKKDGESK